MVRAANYFLCILILKSSCQNKLRLCLNSHRGAGNIFQIGMHAFAIPLANLERLLLFCMVVATTEMNWLKLIYDAKRDAYVDYSHWTN